MSRHRGRILNEGTLTSTIQNAKDIDRDITDVLGTGGCP